MGVEFGNRTVQDPAGLLRSCRDRRISVDLWFRKANCFVCPLGREPGHGYLLMTREELMALDLSKSHDLKINDIPSGGPRTPDKFTLQKIQPLEWTAVSPGAQTDGSSTYLVSIADRRHFLRRYPTGRAFNVRNAAGAYVPATLNVGSPWTWEEMLTAIWGDLPDIGAFPDWGVPAWPGLPFTPGGAPENWSFYGALAWDAIHDVLDRLCCAVAYDPITDTFKVVRLGDIDDEAESVLNDFTDRLAAWDTWGEQVVRAWEPAKIRVLFTRFPAPPTGSNPYYAVDVSITPDAEVFGSTAATLTAGTFVILHDDLSALGATGVPTNAASLATRADERMADWKRTRREFASPYLRSAPGAFKDIGQVFGPVVGEWAWRDFGEGGSQIQAASVWKPKNLNPIPLPPGGTGTPGAPGKGIQDVVHAVAGPDWPDTPGDVFFRKVKRGSLVEVSPAVEYGNSGHGAVYEHADLPYRRVDPDDGTVSHEIPLFIDPSSGDYATDPTSFVGFVEWDEWFSKNTIQLFTDVSIVVTQDMGTCLFTVTETKTYACYDFTQSFFNETELIETITPTPSSWNCVAGVCVEVTDCSSGTYLSLAACQAACP